MDSAACCGSPTASVTSVCVATGGMSASIVIESSHSERSISAGATGDSATVDESWLCESCGLATTANSESSVVWGGAAGQGAEGAVAAEIVAAANSSRTAVGSTTETVAEAERSSYRSASSA